MTDLRTFVLAVVICGVVSVVLRVLPLKLGHVRMPWLIDVIIEQMGKVVATTLLICVLCSFLLHYDGGLAVNMRPPYVTLVAAAYLMGMTKIKTHYVFLGMLAVFFCVSRYAVTS